MDRQNVTNIGRKSLYSMDKELLNSHGIITLQHTDDECYEHGLKVIKWNLELENIRFQEKENDKKYLDSLDPEYRQYIVLKRKYEPNGSFNNG